MGLFFGKRRKSRRQRSRDVSFSANIPLLRWLGPSATLMTIAGALFFVLTGRIDLSSLDAWLGTASVQADGKSGLQDRIAPVSLAMDQRPADRIRIATFNIQMFGKTKASKSLVMQRIAKVVSQFDVVAIQEVRGGDAEPIEKLVQLLQASGANYSATVSEPIGASNQVESYAYVFDQNKMGLIPGSAYLVRDDGERMSREPMVASFETRLGTASGQAPFRFTLVNVHTAPSAVAANAIENEMDALDDVYLSVRSYDYQNYGEEDCILLGDLNVNNSNLREMGQIRDVYSVAGDVATTTRRNKTYDHIMLNRVTTLEYTGQYGVLDLQDLFKISEDEALDISDHQPVWAEFSAYEATGGVPVATASAPTIPR